MNEEDTNVQDNSCEGACCCGDTQTQRATLEEVTLAVEHLAEVIGRFDGRAVVSTFVDEGDGIRRMFRVTDKATEYNKNSSFFEWIGACGFFLKAADCVVHPKHKAISEGVSLYLEKQMCDSYQDKSKAIAAILGLGGSNED